MAAIQFSVLKESDEVLATVGDRNAISNMKCEEEVINRVSALVWDTVVSDWSEDLVRFAIHAGRQTINLEDVSLLVRRNPELFKMACEMAKIAPKKIGEEKELTKKGKPRKRKSNIDSGKQVSPVKDVSRAQSPIFDIRPVTPNNQSMRKKVKLEDGEPSTRGLSFLATPVAKPMTSTPKSLAQIRKENLFINDITPIRQNTGSEAFVKQMPRIEEEQEYVECDSFDKIFGDPAPCTSTKENLTSLIRRAEEDPPPTEVTVMKRIEEAQLEAMMPEEEQYDSFDDDIIVENVVRKRDREEERSKSFDPFASGNESSKEPPCNTTSEKKSTFSKVSDFRFDDEDDSFDSPARDVSNLKKEPTECSDDSKRVENKKRDTKPISEIVDLDDDSFDLKPVKNQKEVSDSQNKVPKWRAMKDRWASLTPKNTSKNSKKVAESASEKKSKSRLSMEYDSFDEFDFGA